jgi:nucleotide-binding universal stress UspA family protein
MKLVVGLDFSEMSERALEVAVNVARRARGAELHLVHVLMPPAAGVELAPSLDIAEMTSDARQNLDDVVERLREWPEIHAYAHVVLGAASKEIVRIADETEADVIVVGTHGRRGLDRALFGSVAENVVRAAPCSVLTVRPNAKSAAESIQPPCADCVAIAAATGGRERTCEHHKRHHPRAHTYSDPQEPFAMGSMTFRFN